MKNNINYAALSLNDIIFIDRNKEYGAYELRESYNRRIKQALFGSLFLTVFACGYQTILCRHHPIAQAKEQEVTIEMTKVEKPKELLPPAAQVEPPKPKGTPDPVTTSNALFVPSDKPDAVDSVPTNEQLAQSVISDHTGGTNPGTIAGTETGTMDIQVHTTPPPPSEPFIFVENMPEYPGGEEAMMRFLADNIDYPTIDKEMGRHGRVTVSFIIDEKGKVTNVQVIKGLSRTLDEESIRVVSKLKTFKPGIQGGRPVRVKYTLPINYQLKDE